jgi:predicted DNA-binding protein
VERKAFLCAIMCHMKRTNFYFPEQMLERLKTASKQQGLPVSELIRRAIEAFLKEMGL